jgi:hypothetical protein
VELVAVELAVRLPRNQLPIHKLSPLQQLRCGQQINRNKRGLL